MQESPKAALFDRIASNLLLVVVMLTPLFLVPFLGFGVEVSKTYFIGLGILVVFMAWIVARMIEGAVSFPKTPIVAAAALLPVVFLISAFFSPAWRVSLGGLFVNSGTVVGSTILSLTFLGSVVYLNTERRIHSLFKGMMIVTAIITVFQLAYFFIGPKYLSLGTLYTNLSNVVGKWNDLGIWYGLVLVVLMLAFQFMDLSRRTKIFAYSIGGFSLLFLIIINFSLLWAVIGFISLLVFVYSLMVLRGDENHTRFPVLPCILLVVSLFFFLAQPLVGSLVSRTTGLTQNEIRPSLVSTGHVMWETVKDRPIVGVGPDRFTNAWYSYQPKSIITTQFWNIDFNAGSGFIPTLIVTTGILGGIIFLAFLALYCIAGVYQTVRKYTDSRAHSYLVSSFTASLFLWIIAFVYTPGTVGLTLAFVSSGIFVGVLNMSGRIPTKQIRFLKDPRQSFFGILLLVIFLLGSLYTVFTGGERFVSLALYSRAQTYASKNDVAGAANATAKAIALYPADLYLRSNTSLALTQINALLKNTSLSQDILKSEFQNSFSAGEASARRALAYDSTNPENWINLALLYQNMIPLEIEGAYVNAKAALEQAGKIAPNNPDIYLLKAKLEVANKNNEGAMTVIKNALVKKPNFLNGIFFMAELEVANGNRAGAIAQLEKTALSDSRNYAVFLQLGIFKYDAGDYAGAVSALERSITLNSGVVNTYYMLGLSYSKVGRVSEALQVFQSLQKAYPENERIAKMVSNLEAGLPPLTGLEDALAPLPETAPADEVTPQTSATTPKKTTTR